MNGASIRPGGEQPVLGRKSQRRAAVAIITCRGHEPGAFLEGFRFPQADAPVDPPICFGEEPAIGREDDERRVKRFSDFRDRFESLAVGGATPEELALAAMI